MKTNECERGLSKKARKIKHKTLKCEKNRIRINTLIQNRVALTTDLSKLRYATSSNYVCMLLSIKNKEKTLVLQAMLFQMIHHIMGQFTTMSDQCYAKSCSHPSKILKIPSCFFLAVC